MLDAAGWVVNVKRVERIWRQEAGGLKVPARQPKNGRLWLNDGSCIRLRPEHPNHVTCLVIKAAASLIRENGNCIVNISANTPFPRHYDSCVNGGQIPSQQGGVKPSHWRHGAADLARALARSRCRC